MDIIATRTEWIVAAFTTEAGAIKRAEDLDYIACRTTDVMYWIEETNL